MSIMGDDDAMCSPEMQPHIKATVQPDASERTSAHEKFVLIALFKLKWGQTKGPRLKIEANLDTLDTLLHLSRPPTRQVR